MTTTYNEQLRNIVKVYRQADGNWPASVREIAEWAVRNEMWKPQPAKIVGQCADDIGRALREQKHTDKQGRTVRTNHAARVIRDGKQMLLWADMGSASPDHMEASFKLRRRHIVGECRSLSVDVDSYNENNNTGPSVQFSFDFTIDLIEQGLADQRVNGPVFSPIPIGATPVLNSPALPAVRPRVGAKG